MLPVGAALGGLLGQSLGSVTAVAIGSVALAGSALPMLTRDIRTVKDPWTGVRVPVNRTEENRIEERQTS